MILLCVTRSMHAILQNTFVQYHFWYRGTLQEKLNLIFSHNQKVISLIQGDKTTKPGDESTKPGNKMAWG